MREDFLRLVDQCRAAGCGEPGVELLDAVKNRGYVVRIFKPGTEDAERVIEILDEMLELTSPPRDPWWVYMVPEDNLAVIMSPKDTAMFRLRLS